MGVSPKSFDLAPLALYSGRGAGAGGEGFTLCSDWYPKDRRETDR